MTIAKFSKQFITASFVFAFGLLMHAQSTQDLNNTADTVEHYEITHKVAIR